MSDTRPTIAYSYLRFSSPSQADGDSIRRQTAAAREWCRKSGALLDDKTTFRHVGSAFTGEHRKNPDRNALALFLEMVKAEKITKGSYLIIESFDRLTREHIQPALLLVLTLLQAGIKIVQLKPVEMAFDSKSDTLPVMMMIVELARGNSESERKSDCLLKAWEEKKREARERGTPMTPNIPAWLEIKNGRFKIVEEKAKIVRYIYELALSGKGSYAITRRLNLEGVAPMGDSGRWTRKYVHSILREGRAKGEHVPKLRSKKQRIPQEPIPNYYPAVIDENTWLRAQEAMDNRRRHRGNSTKRVNLFHGMMRDAVSGGNIWVTVSGGDKDKRYRFLVGSAGHQGGGKFCTFQYEIFEGELLRHLAEIPVESISPPRKKNLPLQALATEEARLANQIAKLENELESSEEVASLVKVIKRLTVKLQEVKGEISTNRRLADSPLDEEWPHAKNLMELLIKSSNPDETKLQLRSALQRTIEEMWLVFAAPSGRLERYCIVQVFFRDSTARRIYLISYRRPCHSHGKRFPGVSFSGSWQQHRRNINLRDREQALRLQRSLENNPPALLPPIIPPKTP